MAALLFLRPPLAAGLDESRVLDLTYAFNESTIHWPTARPFALLRTAFGKTEGGYWYAAGDLCLAEHTGTHMDAPIHFAQGGLTADRVPLTSLIGPAAVIDVRAEAAADPDYRVSVADLRRWEQANGAIPRGAIVLALTGWGRFWPDRAKYLGSDRPGDARDLHFPGFAAEAAEFLVTEREIDAVGIDTASLDHGPSRDFPVHRVLAAANKPGLENIANLDRLPPLGAQIIALPMKIADGSGGPARVIGVLP